MPSGDLNGGSLVDLKDEVHALEIAAGAAMLTDLQRNVGEVNDVLDLKDAKLILEAAVAAGTPGP